MAGKGATAREEFATLRTIGEVAEHLDLPQHVLRFWETRFKEIDPVKRAGGRRFYRPGDIALVEAIRHLLYREGYTIKGVQRILKEQGVEAVVADVRRRQSGESPPPAPPREPQATLDLPDPEPSPPPFVAPPPPIEIDPQARPTPPVPAASPVFNAPVVIARPTEADPADLLREVLAEIEECKRLLRVTRR